MNQGREFFCKGGEASENTPPCSRFERFVAKKNECTACEFGTISKGGMSTSCENCDGIMWTDKCECITGFGTGRELVKGKCRDCLPGTFGTNGVTGCKKCPAGTFRNEALASSGRWDECNLCRPGTFSSGGAAKCKRCPKGTNSHGFGFANCVETGSV